MLRKETLQFLKELKLYNNKEWFDANRPKYQDAKNNFEQLVTEVIGQVAAFDKSVAHLQAKDCVFRINRDVRFSKNKAPYKTNLAMYLSRGGKKALDNAGYYFHLEPGASFLAGGIWMPMAPELQKIRQEIDYSYDALKKILKEKKFSTAFGDFERSEGTVLSRPPKGYDADNEAIEYLKLKSFIASAKMPDKILSDKQLAKEIAQQFKVMFPLVQFLNTALGHE